MGVLRLYTVCLFLVHLYQPLRTTGNIHETEELVCESLKDGSSVMSNSLSCPVSGHNQTSIVLLDINNDDNSSMSQRVLEEHCNGKETCEFHKLGINVERDSMFTVNYVCIEAPVYRVDNDEDEFITTQKGLLHVTTSGLTKVSFSTRQNGLSFRRIQEIGNITGCDVQMSVRISNFSQDMSDQQLPHLSATIIHRPTCFPTYSSDDVVELWLNPSNGSEKGAPKSGCPLLIYFEGVDHCRYGDSFSSLSIHTTVCRAALRPPAQPAGPAPSDEDAPGVDEVPRGDGVDKAALIGVVVTVAVIIVATVSAVLIVRLLRKRRRRERPLVDISPKIEASEQSIQLNEITTGKGYVHLDATAGFDPPPTDTSKKHWRLSPATTDEGILNASFTDAIDLDASENSDGTRPFESAKAQNETVGDNTSNSSQGTAKTGELSETYEGAFEGSLETVITELEKIQDSDSLKSNESPEVLNAESDESSNSSESGEISLTENDQSPLPFTMLEMPNDETKIPEQDSSMKTLEDEQPDGSPKISQSSTESASQGPESQLNTETEEPESGQAPIPTFTFSEC